MVLTLFIRIARVGWVERQPQPLTLSADATVGSMVLCWLFTATTGMWVTTATDKTVPGSADVQCTGEGSSTVDTGMTAHIGERSAKTHEL